MQAAGWRDGDCCVQLQGLLAGHQVEREALVQADLRACAWLGEVMRSGLSA